MFIPLKMVLIGIDPYPCQSMSICYFKRIEKIFGCLAINLMPESGLAKQGQLGRPSAARFNAQNR